ncbi:PEGA domain-containing protein [Alkalispirochaeta americana]|uniref:PEGA domain-containing protein n=1 Tax=Alkalispirochaeta americana TaxID=159291 RepID=A0A1N6NLI0_9SPIO|nr:PEGA domain-containing protein [Alkalispirochaeta americana]SIP92883.1 PEGA domain-containing protein [Alkalispirochaeta americana]
MIKHVRLALLVVAVALGVGAGNLFAQAMTTLELHSNVRGAEVYINDRLVGEADPVFSMRLRSRGYSLRVTAPGHEDFTSSIRLQGPRQELRVELVPLAGTATKPPPEPQPDPAPATPPPPADPGVAVTFHWHAADTADIYINGVALREFSPPYATRRDEAPLMPFQHSGTLRDGDVITVGTRRGGSFGFMMAVVDQQGRVLVRTDRNWQYYDPAGSGNWYNPSFAEPRLRGSVGVNPSPWGNQRHLVSNYGPGIESIYSPSTSDRRAYLYYRVSLGREAPRVAEEPAATAPSRDAPSSPGVQSGVSVSSGGFFLGRYRMGLSVNRPRVEGSILDFRGDGTFQVISRGPHDGHLASSGRWHLSDDVFSPGDPRGPGVVVDFEGGGFFGSQAQLVGQGLSYYHHVVGDGMLYLIKEIEWDVTGEWMNDGQSGGFRFHSDGTFDRYSLHYPERWRRETTSRWTTAGNMIVSMPEGRVLLLLEDPGTAYNVDRNNRKGTIRYSHTP